MKNQTLHRYLTGTITEEGYVKEEVNGTDQKAIIIKFFRKYLEPTDKQVHALANKLRIDEHAFEQQIYKILGNYINNVGKHTGTKDSAYDPKELALGVKIEMEHTSDPEIAKEIAKDHLAEIKDYYTRLVAMEKEAKSE